MGFTVDLVFDDIFRTSNHPFDDRFSIDGPLVSFEGWDFAPEGWGGLNRFSINSRPDPFDTSTWGWDAVFQITGPDLAARVPETGGLLCLVIGLLALPVFWRLICASKTTIMNGAVD